MNYSHTVVFHKYIHDEVRKEGKGLTIVLGKNWTQKIKSILYRVVRGYLSTCNLHKREFSLLDFVFN